MSFTPPPRSHLLLLALIVAFAAGLRSYDLGGLGFWTDEFCSISVANGWGLQFDHVPIDQPIEPGPICTKHSDANSPLQIIPGLIRDDLHPPIYFVLLRMWMTAFGDSEIAVRSLNVVLSTLAVALLYFAGRPAVGSAAALWACLLMAVATPAIQMSQEARNYTLGVVVCLCGAIATQRHFSSPAKANAAFVIVALLAMALTHYFTIAVAAALFVAYRSRRGLLAFTIAGVIFLVIWGPFAIRQFRTTHGGTDWLIATGANPVIENFLRLPVRLIAENASANFQTFSIWIGCVFWSSALAAIFRRSLHPWVLWLAFAVGIVAVQDIARHSTQLNWLRYTLFASPAIYLLTAGMIPTGRWRFVPAMVGVIAGLLCLWSAYVPAWKIDFRTPIESSIGNRLTTEDAVLIVGPNVTTDGIVAGAVRHYLPRTPATLAVLTKAPDEKLLRRLRASKQVWVIALKPDPAALAGFITEERGESPGLGVLLRGSFKP